MAKPLDTTYHPSHEEISARAHRIYQMEGCPEGRASEHWLQAEAQLIAEHKPQSPHSESKPVKPPSPTVTKPARSTKPRVSKRTRSTLPISTRPRVTLGQD